MRWFTSDLHLGHANIIKYCHRPSPDAGAMNASLVAAWNAVVAPNDDVWVLGDLAMGHIDEMLPVASQLVGHKHLVVGNHDRPFEDGPRRAEWTDERYLNHRPVDDGTWLLHGHVHDSWRQQGHMINVGVDAWAGRPVSEETFLDRIRAGETDLPSLDWT